MEALLGIGERARTDKNYRMAIFNCKRGLLYMPLTEGKPEETDKRLSDALAYERAGQFDKAAFWYCLELDLRISAVIDYWEP